jgi:hypothetical protein
MLAEDWHWATVQEMTGSDVDVNPESRVTRIKKLESTNGGLASSRLTVGGFTATTTSINLHSNIVGHGFALSDEGTAWLLSRLADYFRAAFFFDPFRHSTREHQASEVSELDQTGGNLAGVLHTILSNSRPLFDSIEAFIHGALPDIGGLQTPLKHSSTNIEFSAVDANYSAHIYDMGGGIKQLLMVAVVLLTKNDESTLFLEEPESHLHAGAQRFVIDKLQQGNRQVFVTSHSPVFINTPHESSLYSVVRRENRTRIDRILETEELKDVLNEIGSRNSDVLLSDSVLFVEGPGDQQVFMNWSETLGLSFDERNITVLAMGGGDNSDRRARVRSEILQAISKRAPVPHLLVVDGDERSKSETDKLKESLAERIHLLRKRELENYFLIPRALVQALRLKHADDAPLQDRLNKASLEQLAEIIRTTADTLYGVVLMKRIRVEIGGLKGGLLTRESVVALAPSINEADFSNILREQIESRVSSHLGDLHIENVINRERQLLDSEWSNSTRRLELAPGEELVNAVFQHFGSEYKKPKDTKWIAGAMVKEEIDDEIKELVQRVVALGAPT